MVLSLSCVVKFWCYSSSRGFLKALLSFSSSRLLGFVLFNVFNCRVFSVVLCVCVCACVCVCVCVVFFNFLWCCLL
ncbi:hypothetical protein BD408DRAFT_409126 [Parasitella parasitica]|nr:hypothetical protein BD408DRAFT_409126 [Parasitella parasitica]